MRWLHAGWSLEVGTASCQTSRSAGKWRAERAGEDVGGAGGDQRQDDAGAADKERDGGGEERELPALAERERDGGAGDRADCRRAGAVQEAAHRLTQPCDWPLRGSALAPPAASGAREPRPHACAAICGPTSVTSGIGCSAHCGGWIPAASAADRKSTRLNSSHQIISYAVFCLKKKKNNQYSIFHNKKKNKNKTSQ